VLTDEAPRARVLVRIVFFPLYLISGVVLPLHTLSSDVLPWLLWNPVAHALEVSRGLYFSAYHPIAQASASYVYAFALLALVCGLSLYRVRRHRLVAL
jgi:capsular polysaccharide transport system permease protein